MNTLLGFPDNPEFGPLLRQWRTSRHLSQLALATDAGISTRHLSFLETGRAQPSREMVQLLAGMLDVPFGERNALLVSAGYAPLYGERALAAPELEHVRRALDFVLRQQEPYPAFVVDGLWNMHMRNEATRRVFELFTGPAPEGRTVNVMRTVFDPRGLRQYIVNWHDVAECAMHSIHRAVATTGGRTAIALRDELLAYPDVPSRWKSAECLAPMAPLVSMHLKKGDLSLAFFSMITMLATPRDVTLQQLRIECFFPADAATDQFARRIALPEAVAV